MDLARLRAPALALAPEQGCRPVNKYLPLRPRTRMDEIAGAALQPVVDNEAGAIARWVDRILSR